MAKIKVSGGGKVLTKGGKVSCGCCKCVYTEEQWQEIIFYSPENTFEITKEEFNRYFNGGNWQIDVSWTQFELVTSKTPNCTATSSASGSTNQFAEGCNHLVQDVVFGSVTYTGPCFGNLVMNYAFIYGIELFLGKVGSKFYAHYTAFSNVSTSNIISPETPHPVTIDFKVDGNSLVAFRYWSPSWSSFDGYTNNSESILTATFTPNELPI